MSAGPEISLAQVLAATGGGLLSGPKTGEVLFRGISTDSRKCREGNLFIALAGKNFDGHDYLAQARRQGAAGVLVHRRTALIPDGIPVIVAGDTLRALGDLASWWRRLFRATVIAVTGSSGKTTTKEMIAAIMARRGKILKTEGNFNNLIGLPLTLLRMRPDDATAVLELGTNTPGEIARLTRIARPDIALITNIGPAHLEGFTDLAGVAAEKKDLFRGLPAKGTMIVNRDDPFLREEGRDWSGGVVTFGLHGGADVYADGIIPARISEVGAADRDGGGGVDRPGTRFTLHLGEERQEMVLPVPGGHQLVNALAAAASAWAAGADRTDIALGLGGFTPPSGRMEIVALDNGAFVINDAYNANPASVREALRTLQLLKGRGRGIAVLGDMLELGDGEAAWHEEIGALLADVGVARVYLQGRLSGATAAGASKRGLPTTAIIVAADREEIVRDLRAYLRTGDWVLVKGSRRLEMDKVTAALRQTDGEEGGLP
ncbi:MAG: UDP-N-acetylmuramoyl-tripeptide--D-alanyl-D-alanine ligase [Pseudomonadota bacterium]|nr:UDP-N-acetylmuramoyl-tripeptide--D-alanyl-D-alanine ligase [Pseudomonadota bacterium]